MATYYHGRNQSLIVSTPTNILANYNLSGDLMETTLPLSQDVSDITTGGSVGHRFYPGLMKSSGSFKFVADGAANSSWIAFSNYAAMQQAKPPTANYYSASFGPGGATANSPAINFNFIIKDCSLPVKVADVVTMTVAWEADNGFTVSNY